MDAQTLAPSRPRRLARLVRVPDMPRVIREGPSQHAVAVRERRYRLALLLADLLALLLAAVLATSAAGDGPRPALLVLVGLGVVAAKLGGLYDRDELLLHKTTLDELPTLAQLAAFFSAAFWLGERWFVDGPLAKAQVIALWALVVVLALVGRWAARALARRLTPTERCLLVGDARAYARFEAKLGSGDAGAELVGRVALSDHLPGDGRAEDAIRRAVRDLEVHRVVIVPDRHDPEGTLEHVRAAKAVGVRVSLVPQVVDVLGSAVVFDDVGGMTVLGMRRLGLPRSSRVIKRGLDLAGATLVLVATAPLLLALAVAIKLDSRGPVLFRQVRVGRGGRRFRIVKFRTMVPDAEARKAELFAFNEADGLFKIAEDPRITRVGRLLRKTSLDELPQLLNVVRGEMSLVGPRPLIAAEDEAITGYDRERLALTPGMTGQWQILGSSRVPLAEMVKLDYLYVASWSLWGDLKILLRTVPFMLARRGM